MKKTKRLISLLLCVLLGISCLPVSVHAQDFAARTDSVDYETLEEAVAAAGEGGTVYLLSDVHAAGTVTVDKSIILACAEGTDCTVSVSAGSVFDIAPSGSLTLAGVTVAGSASGAAVTVSGGTLNMRSGTQIFSYASSGAGAVNAVSGRVNLMGGSVSGTGDVLVAVGSGADLCIAGDISFDGAVSVSLPENNCIEIPADLSGSGRIVISLQNPAADTQVAFFSGETEIAPEQVARFFVNTTPLTPVYVSGRSLYVSGEGSSVSEARYNGSEYATLKEAIDAVPEGTSGVVELIGNVLVPQAITVKGKSIILNSDGDHTVSRTSSNRWDYMFNIASGATLSVGFSGGSVTVTGSGISATMPAFNAQGTLAIGPKAKISGHTNNNPNIFYQGTVIVPKGGRMTMNGGSFTSNETNKGTVLVYGGSFAMSGGTISSNKSQFGGGVCISGGSFAMSGGVISGNTANTAGGAVWCDGDFSLSGNAAILSDASHRSDIYLAKGRTISVDPRWRPAASDASSAIVSISPQETARDTKVAVMTSGKATPANALMFTLFGALAETNSIRAKDNYLYIGEPGSGEETVYVGDKGFSSMKEAFESVPANGTPTEVIVTGDTVMNETAVVAAGQNIVLKDGRDPVKDENYESRTITRTPLLESTMFLVSEGGTLALTSTDAGRLVISGKDVNASGSMIFTAGALTLSRNVTLSDNAVRKGESLTAAAPVLVTGGAVLVGAKGSFVMDGGTIKDNYASEGGAVCVLNGYFRMNAGQIVSNSAVYGGAVCVLNTLVTDNRDRLDAADKKDEKDAAPGTAANNTANTAANTAAADAAAAAADTEGVFEMYGGEITGNKANVTAALVNSGMGGGVCVGNGATFRMKGGSVKANSGEKGATVCVGLARPEKDEGKTVPVFEVYGGAGFGTDCDVYLTLRDDSRVIVRDEKLTGITKEAPLALRVSDDNAQNSIVAMYRLDGKNAAENRKAAKNTAAAGLITAGGAQKALYTIDTESDASACLVNTVGESAACFRAAREYDGLEKYETEKTQTDTEKEGENSGKPAEKTDAKEAEKPGEKKEISYSRFSMAPDGVFTATFEMSRHSELYKDMHTLINGALPVGTAITMIDKSGDAPAAYWYKVTGKENNSDYAARLAAEKLAADEGNEEVSKALEAKLITEQKTTVRYIEIDLSMFMKMGTDDVHYTAPAAKKAEDGKVLPVTEKMTFVVDFSGAELGDKEVLIGNYSFFWSHRYVTAAGKSDDISYNFGRAEYTVTNAEAAEIKLTAGEDDKIIVSYSLTAASRICINGNGAIILAMDNGFPEGTVVTADGNSYPATGSGHSISIPLPRDSEGNPILKGRMELKLNNYFGAGIPGYSLSAKLCPSGDGRYPAYSSKPDAESENITVMLPAPDVYAIRTENSDGRKPIYESKDLENAGSVSFTLTALCNSTSCEKVVFSLEKSVDGEYVTVPLSQIFSGFEEAGDGAVAIKPGNVDLVFVPDAASKGGTYRLVFTAGDKTEYVKLAF